MSIDVASIAQQILSQAVTAGGKTWEKIRKAAPFFIEGYAQSLAKAALAVANGDVTAAEGRMIVSHARLIMMQGIAFSTVVILSQIQAFMDGVIDTVKSAINAALPVSIL